MLPESRGNVGIFYLFCNNEYFFCRLHILYKNKLFQWTLTNILCYLLSMKLDKRVVDNITHVDLVALSPDMWVLLHHEPADVREEKPATSVVRIR